MRRIHPLAGLPIRMRLALWNVGVLARVPFDEGGLTGKITPETTFPKDDFRNNYFKGDRKREVFHALSGLTGPEVILASNTSSVSISALAAATCKPDRVAGMHFFNPVPVMTLLELVRGLQTSDETMDVLRQFGQSLRKTVIVAKDTPGFIVNYLLVPYLLDAVRMVENDVASMEDGRSQGANAPECFRKTGGPSDRQGRCRWRGSSRLRRRSPDTHAPDARLPEAWYRSCVAPATIRRA